MAAPAVSPVAAAWAFTPTAPATTTSMAPTRRRGRASSLARPRAAAGPVISIPRFISAGPTAVAAARASASIPAAVGIGGLLDMGGQVAVAELAAPRGPRPWAAQAALVAVAPAAAGSIPVLDQAA